ncbi:unnamed protein product [Gemmata massiliana]|uniref:Uncharacterized protein n=1 Tax=Gemmata massiliana TaxID=1210884 RepID=A0A6P2D6Y6_9BACT|nr:hypothetical protein [Gemmata massiliana]VTR95242.1 unnamed protein product [Gemmata massiliana]
MSTTKEALARRTRQFRRVELPGGAVVHVRDISLGELRAIDLRAEEIPEGPDRNLRRIELLCLYALADEDGAPTFAERTDAQLVEMADLTPAEMEAITAAAVPDKEAAKN